MPILPIAPNTPLPITTLAPKPAPGTSASSGFADLLDSAFSTVESTQSAAKQATKDLLIGGKGEIHEVALISQQAELTLELFQQVRNKLVQAYQEVMRMPM